MLTFYLGLILIAAISNVASFNLDVKNPIIAVGKSDSYFGYSVAVHQNSNLNWLLVGAPKERNPARANESIGAVHQCERRGMTFTCNIANIIQNTRETDQWLGATVISKKGTALACAPRTGDEARGQCYYSKGNLQTFSTYASFTDTILNGISFCELGFSAAFSTNGNQLFTGGPSCDQNEGRLFGPTYPLQSLTYYDDTGIDLSYFTYALASGNVLNGVEGLVASIAFHQNSKFAGKVILLDTAASKLRVVSNLVGYQPGEHFGGSLAVSDLNNDGRDDIVIGAAFHTDYSKAELKYEVGAVYVYYQTFRGVFQRGIPDELILKGQMTGGHFGYALAALDTNADNFNDLAIGAPHEGSNGIVYLYYGTKDGLRKEPGQVITGKSFSPPKSTFGFAFAVSDFDGNKYTDLMVGAYQSDSVVYLPARPVVKIASQMTFKPEYITLERRDCDLVLDGQPSTKVPCATLTYCLTYTGIGVPPNQNVDVTINLDVKQAKTIRLLFLDTKKSNLTVRMGLLVDRKQCQDKVVYVKPDIRDKLSPMEVLLIPVLVEPVNPPPLSPVLDIYNDGTATNSLSIFKDCGPDLICVPDLQLTATLSTSTFIQGSDERLFVDVTIYNGGEDAYGAEFYLDLPSTLAFINTERNVTNSSVICFPPGELNGPVLRCEIGNPLPASKTIRISIILKPNPGTDENFISFLAETNSTNKEESYNLNNNKKMLDLNFKANTSLFLIGWSRPETLLVNVTALQEEGAVLPTYLQFYEILNGGPSDVLSAEFMIASPTKTPEGYAISTWTSQPIIEEGSATCDPFQDTGNSVVLKCRTETLLRSKRIVVRVSARISTEALVQIKDREKFNLTSIMTANVTGMLYGQDPSMIPMAKTQVTFVISKMPAEKTVLQAIPWWIPVVSAVGAVLILAIIVAVLYKYGFFKRNKPPHSATLQPPESEPLQEQGQQQQQRPLSERDYTYDEDSSPR